jgi:tetratricopeptide (TPR) repeat protein/AraC-like DNA-binding protein
VPLLPRDVKKAVALLQADPGRKHRIDELAAQCGVARRTLEKHFRRFVGRSPSQVKRELLLERVRRELLRASPEATTTEIAVRCGIGHLGRFAAAYRERYGESPSTTLQGRRWAFLRRQCASPILSPTVNRPIISVHPFDIIGVQAQAGLTIGNEISAALTRNRWLAVGRPGNARYRLRGTVRDDDAQRVRVLVMLTDAATGQHLWADRWDGEVKDAFAFEERVAERVASAVERSVRAAEVQRACHMEPEQLGAWELTMKSLPRALLIEPTAQAEAIELLERAMELAPQDALPIALAAWCHGQRASHHLGPRPNAERQTARELARRAERLSGRDPNVEALLAAAYTLGRDLESAAIHCDRALALDGGCVWAWNRKGMLNAYLGRSADAIECFQFARSLGPNDPLNFFCSIGIGSAHFQAGRYEDAARWFTRGLNEHPVGVWVNRFRAPAFALAGQMEQARRSFTELTGEYPELTLGDVRSALPHTPSYSNLACDGLASLGMRP